LTYTRFIIKNSFRNKRRTALTVLSIGFSLFLLILLQTLIDVFSDPPGSDESVFRLVVQRSTAFVDQMPIAYRSRLEEVPHVELVVPMQMLPAYYRDPRNFFPALATDPHKIWDMFPEQKVSEEAKRRLERERIGAVVGQKLAERFGWKLDDRITLISQVGSMDFEFIIVGIYTSEIATQNDALYFRLDYLDEAMETPGQVGFFWLKADSIDAVPGIKDTIDSMFRNTPAETRTETEKSFILGMVAMMGNLKLFMRSIAAVVVFTMLLVAASTMGMSIRERMREIAILKSIGYTRLRVLILILGEAVFIALLGAGVGCLVAYGMRSANILYRVSRGFFPDFPVTVQTYSLALGIGLGIGLFSALIPAMQASRLTITQALRRLD
jgi:putative ABC transport system permease protein